MDRHTNTIKTLSEAFQGLISRIVTREEELHRCEASIGRSHNIRRMNKIRDEIANLERRAANAEQLLNRALSGEFVL